MSAPTLSVVSIFSVDDLVDQLETFDDDELIAFADGLLTAIHERDPSAGAAFVAGIEAATQRLTPPREGAE